ncbi:MULTISPECIES: TauD/TfdA family dioxygenase [unclassified Phenylobacterium]|uniref:TauD/TfdA dioxygenase family protein n=1 Tax=unclassified Phenylobacterium TaxID=2640670 RepID=UPI00083B6AEA|nr:MULTISPECIES: TauD/TfdA family dioxygenase [unclassified Phenylobacterium]
MSAALKTIEPIGVEVDLDLRSPEHDDEVKALFEEHGFLLFRNQDLTQDQQRRILARLGPVLEDFRTVGYVSNTRKDGILGDADVSFHSDFIYTPVPALGISLHAIEVPYEETWTSFANAVRALNKLPPQLRERISTLTGLNLFAASEEGLGGRQRLEGYPAGAPQATHPLIGVDPITKRETLYVTQQNTTLIPEVDEAESEAILAELNSYLYAPENIYQHRWRNGDFIVWSNQALHHARGGLVPGKTRTLQRVCITEAVPDQYDAPIPDDRLPEHMRKH